MKVCRVLKSPGMLDLHTNLDSHPLVCVDSLTPMTFSQACSLSHTVAPLWRFWATVLLLFKEIYCRSAYMYRCTEMLIVSQSWEEITDIHL